MHWILTYFFKKNTLTMSVSAAISSANFEALEQAVTGKDNEVFSTILFDSYDDKRIEELLLLEAANIIKDLYLDPKSAKTARDLQMWKDENCGIYLSDHYPFSIKFDL